MSTMFRNETIAERKQIEKDEWDFISFMSIQEERLKTVTMGTTFRNVEFQIVLFDVENRLEN